MTDPWEPVVRGTRRAAPDEAVVRFVEEVRRNVDRPTGLDLGCGGGRHLRYLQLVGVDAVGLDGSPAASRAKGLTVLLHDLTEPLPVEDCSFDFAILWGVFLHIDPAFHEALLGEVHRVLAPGGFFLMDFLRPDDFRNRLGRPIRASFNRSPFIEGVTDFFCEAEHVRSLVSSFQLLEERDISYQSPPGGLVSQVCLRLRRPPAMASRDSSDPG